MRYGLLLILLLTGCTSMKFRDYGSFKDWYWHSGYSRTIAPQERPTVFAHFRTPEVLIQPAGGVKMFAIRARSGSETHTNTERGSVRVNGRSYNYEHTTQYEGERFENPATERGYYSKAPVQSIVDLGADGGVLDLIPYRLWTANNRDIDEKVVGTPVHMIGFPLVYAVILPFRAVALVTHDVYKTLMLPVAYLHYKK